MLAKNVQDIKIIFWTMFALLLGFVCVSTIYYSKYTKEKNTNEFYLKELKTESSKSFALKEQLNKLTKGNEDIVPIIKRLRPQLDHSIVVEISAAIIKYSKKYKLPPELITHLINRESSFNALAVSKKNAVGLMQILPKFHKDKWQEKMEFEYEELFHINKNIMLGCWILRDYYDQTNSIEKALKKYVGGNHNGYIDDILIGYTNETIPERKDNVSKNTESRKKQN